MSSSNYDLTGYTNQVSAIAARDQESERLREMRAIKDRYNCPDCGADDGMQIIEWHAVELYELYPEELYRYKDADYALFSPCWQCNAHDVIPPKYVKMTFAEAIAWAKDYQTRHPDEVAYWKHLKETI